MEDKDSLVGSKIDEIKEELRLIDEKLKMMNESKKESRSKSGGSRSKGSPKSSRAISKGNRPHRSRKPPATVYPSGAEEVNEAKMRNCYSVLKEVMKHEYAWPFNVAVDPVVLNLPDYFNIIKEPMDLGTVLEKFEGGEYLTPEEFVADVRLTFNNARVYNPRGSDVNLMANVVSDYFEAKYASIGDEGAPALPPKRMKAPTRKQISKPVQSRKGELTFEEKKQLSEAISQINPNKLVTIINIIKESLPGIADNNNEEIVIDIESLDTVTLHKLEDFVYSSKSGLSKSRKSGSLDDEEDKIRGTGDHGFGSARCRTVGTVKASHRLRPLLTTYPSLGSEFIFNKKKHQDYEGSDPKTLQVSKSGVNPFEKMRSGLEISFKRRDLYPLEKALRPPSLISTAPMPELNEISNVEAWKSFLGNEMKLGDVKAPQELYDVYEAKKVDYLKLRSHKNEHAERETRKKIEDERLIMEKEEKRKQEEEEIRRKEEEERNRRLLEAQNELDILERDGEESSNIMDEQEELHDIFTGHGIQD